MSENCIYNQIIEACKKLETLCYDNNIILDLKISPVGILQTKFTLEL